jgi:transcription-repair coupling factor (superfamily II helicase)
MTQLESILKNLKPHSIAAQVAFPAQAQLLVSLARTLEKPVVHVVPQDKDAATLAILIRFIDPKTEVLVLPAWDTLPYDRISPAAAIQSQRLAVLSRLARRADSKPYILLTTLNAASQKLLPKSELLKAAFSLRTGSKVNHEALMRFLGDYGYHRAGKVMEAGEFAVRGSLIDIFPAGAEEGVRIDLFGDEVESLKSFDPLTQLSAGTLDSLDLLPVSEVVLNDTTVSRFRQNYLDLFGAVTKQDPLYESISAVRPYPGMEHWLPLFYDHLDTLADYTGGALFSMDYRVPPLHEERSEAVKDYYDARRTYVQKDAAPYHPIKPGELFLGHGTLLSEFDTRMRVTVTPFATEKSDEVLTLNLKSSPQLAARRHGENLTVADTAAEFVRNSSKPIVIAANSAGSADRIHKLLHIPAAPLAESLKEALKTNPSVTVLPIEQGYETHEYLLLSEQDLFGERIIRTAKKKKKSETFMAEAASFAEGEAIVHREHGIGRYEGLVAVEVGGSKHDCLKLVYDGGDKLFLPVENIDLISRFGSSDEMPGLDKLGGVAWQKRKSSLKKRLKMAAEALIKVAAERAAKTAPSFSPEAGIYDEFAARFPYTETDDQLQAIEDVRTDLASGHAMDRLICGDVGFGKTEVAMRAAFLAAASGVQVAVIAPTTLLARQHFHNFRERFNGLPYSIRMLSRLTTAKDAKETREQLSEGKVDIVIGTHALLANTVHFKKLGLLIVDEEQHFGVAQKEKLKGLKTDIHVLTLSATPIPRTLQMALSGVRELSLITTPPIDRLAVRTYVMPYDPVIIREALLREYNRGGKSFYVTPRVKYMAELEVKIRELVPEVKIAVAHGQMAAGHLDKVMNEFYDGKYDVLLSTAIIESGIDIPTANTMIIDRGQLFGLSQLYQLRGRVGRSKTRAYAYFTLPHNKLLSRHAERRLEVMQQLDSLGAGFQLASHDMDIRGFGNLLGEEQSGHIKEVGIELYQSMLEEAIADIKRRKLVKDDADLPSEDWSPQINLGTSVFIPESYIDELSLRLSIYRRAATLPDEAAVEGFAAELVDRFGALPPEVEHFLEIIRIKIMCKRGCIARLDAGPKGIVFAFRHNKFPAPDALIAHIARNPNRIKLRADQTLFVAGDYSQEATRLKGAESVAREITNLIPKTEPLAA